MAQEQHLPSFDHGHKPVKALGIDQSALFFLDGSTLLFLADEPLSKPLAVYKAIGQHCIEIKIGVLFLPLLGLLDHILTELIIITAKN